MKFSLASFLATFSVLPSLSMGKSAKFTANWQTEPITLAEFNSADDTATSYATELLATIRVPNNKDLLIGMSGVVNLVTMTQVTSALDGEFNEASSEATVNVIVKYAPTGTMPLTVCEEGTTAAPGMITLASRKQTFSLEALIGAATEEDYIRSNLEIDTTASHHFNFVAIDLPTGVYDVVACYVGEADGSVTGEGEASAYAAIHARMVTVEEVQAVKGDLEGPVEGRRLGSNQKTPIMVV